MLESDPTPPERLDVSQVLRALADPVRLAIVKQLAGSSDPVTCGSFDVPVSKSTLSHHFRILREAGVMASTRAPGNRSLNVLRAEELDEAFPGLLNSILPHA